MDKYIIGEIYETEIVDEGTSDSEKEIIDIFLKEIKEEIKSWKLALKDDLEKLINFDRISEMENTIPINLKQFNKLI